MRDSPWVYKLGGQVPFLYKYPEHSGQTGFTGSHAAETDKASPLRWGQVHLWLLLPNWAVIIGRKRLIVLVVVNLKGHIYYRLL